MPRRSRPPFRSAPELEWVNPPQQARSQQTLERLIDAAEHLVEEKGIEAVTVAAVAKQAGSSVGSFYSRFKDKDALLRVMFERFGEQALATAEAVLVAERWQGIPLGEGLELMAHFMLRILGERQQLIVGLLTRAASDPELRGFGQRLHALLTERLSALITARATPAHPDPPVAVAMAIWMVLSLMESRALFGREGLPQLTDAEMAREMARMVTRYVGLDESLEGDVAASA